MTILEKLKALLPIQAGVTVAQAEEDEDDLDYDDFVGEDDWEDGPEINRIRAKYPEGWMAVKVTNFTRQTLADVKEWCKVNCTEPYDHIGWDTGCSYTVGVIFEGHTDAVMFKLIWGA